jgi:hypothetical protein
MFENQSPFDYLNLLANQLTCSNIQLHGTGISWKVDSSLPEQGIPWFFGTRRFIAVFRKAHHWTLFWTSWIPFTTSFYKVHFNITSHILLDLPSGLFCSNTFTHLYLPLSATYSAQFSLFHLLIVGILKIYEEYKHDNFHYVIFSIFSYFIQIFSSAFRPQAYSNYVLPLDWGTKFHIHMKEQIKQLHTHIHMCVS